MALPNNNNPLAFLIVTYKEKYWECKSFLSLLYSYKQQDDRKYPLSIVVIDNTEEEMPLDHPIFQENISVRYYSYGQNMGVSKAYNKGVGLLRGQVDKVVFLDQDTNLPIDFYDRYLEVILSINPLVACPLIYANNNLVSPIKFKNYRPIKHINDNKGDWAHKKIDFENHSIINSGLMVDIRLFDEIGGYNENLFLDFCDHDFIQRMKSQIASFVLINVVIQQDLSSYTDNKERALKRYHFYLRDRRVFFLNKDYWKSFLYVDLPHLLKLTYKFKSFSFLKAYLFDKFFKR